MRTWRMDNAERAALPLGTELRGVPELVAQFSNSRDKADRVAKCDLERLEERTRVIDLGLEVINSVIEPGEVLPDVIGIDLVLVGELRDHHVVGVESTLHHPLALEDLLLHCFEPRLHASGLLGPLNITDVQHPLTHLDRLRVLQHSRELDAAVSERDALREADKQLQQQLGVLHTDKKDCEAARQAELEQMRITL
ncbi:DNA-directed RNA polymerase subunit beta [Hordeum vulgare]|nr:DNA-directed RNA polymerase subunit beta [Hordeum vulgare]